VGIAAEAIKEAKMSMDSVIHAILLALVLWLANQV
jgi:hypothetical protein